jgi:hypothetical protein
MGGRWPSDLPRGKMNPSTNSSICRLTGRKKFFPKGSSNEGAPQAPNPVAGRRSLCKCGEKTPLPQLDELQIGRRNRSVHVPASDGASSTARESCVWFGPPRDLWFLVDRCPLGFSLGRLRGWYISAGKLSLRGEVVGALVAVLRREVEASDDE